MDEQNALIPYDPRQSALVAYDSDAVRMMSLQQRIMHPETLPEEKKRLWAELQALLAQFWESLKTAFVELGKQIVEAFRPIGDLLASWARNLWKRAYPTASKLRTFPPLPDKRAWQHSQKVRAQVKRLRRERARHRTALAYQYRAKR